MTNSFSYRVDPIGTTDLGKGNSFKSYRKHIPVVWCASDAVRRLAGQFTVQFSSELDKAGTGTSYTFQTIVSGLPRGLKKLTYDQVTNREYPLEHTLITSCLLGRRTLTVCSYEVKEQTLSTRSEKLYIPSPIRAKRILVHETASQITDVAIPFSPTNINTAQTHSHARAHHRTPHTKTTHVFPRKPETEKGGGGSALLRVSAAEGEERRECAGLKC